MPSPVLEDFQRAMKRLCKPGSNQVRDSAFMRAAKVKMTQVRSDVWPLKVGLYCYDSLDELYQVVCGQRHEEDLFKTYPGLARGYARLFVTDFRREAPSLAAAVKMKQVRANVWPLPLYGLTFDTFSHLYYEVFVQGKDKGPAFTIAYLPEFFKAFRATDSMDWMFERLVGEFTGYFMLDCYGELITIPSYHEHGDDGPEGDWLEDNPAGDDATPND